MRGATAFISGKDDKVQILELSCSVRFTVKNLFIK